VAVEAVGFGFNGLAMETVAVTTLVRLGIKDSVVMLVRLVLVGFEFEFHTSLL